MKLLNKQLQKRVRQILMNYPKARDCDRFLTVQLWCYEARDIKETPFGEDIQYWDLEKFLNNYVDRKLTLADSITRCRRKLQEEDKTLRGSLWYKRKGRAEEVKQEMIDYKYQ